MSVADSKTESTGSLLSDVVTRVSSLVRKEVDLARAEVDQNLRRAATAIGLLVAGVVIALTALNVLAGAIVAGLTEAGIDAGWSACIVGVVFGIIAFALFKKGTNDLSLSSLAPSRTAENVKRDARAVQGAVSDE